MDRKLTRNTGNKILGGVCSGIADYLNVDPTVIRVLFALGIVFTAGWGFLGYLACWFVMPARTA